MADQTRHVLIVGVDDTDASVAAVRWAAREARLRHATIRLVSSWHHDPRLRAPYAPALRHGEKDREAAARSRLRAAADVAGQLVPAARLESELTDEPPVRALLSRAADADLLVLGAVRRRQSAGEHPAGIGAVARACIRLAPCAVVVVTGEDVNANRASADR